MARRYIALELESDTLHLAVSSVAEQGPQLEEVRSLGFSPEEGPLETLRALQQELQPGLADTVELLLPAVSAYARLLKYPFKSKRKLAGVVPPDFWYRLPVDSDGLLLDYVRRSGDGEQSQVAAVAVPSAQLRAVVEIFAAAEFPLGKASVLPGCLNHSEESSGERKLVAWQREGELGIALYDGGEIGRYALLPNPGGQTAEIGTWLQQQAEKLERHDGWEGLPVILYGVKVPLGEALAAAGRQVQAHGLDTPECSVSGAQSRVAWLALEGLRAGKGTRHNFLRGEFAPVSGWQGLRRPLKFSLGLLLGVVILGVVTLWSGYQRQVRETAQLEQRAEQQLRATFPEIQTIRDASRQMQSQLQQLRGKAGSGMRTDNSPLQLLRSMSQQLPENLDVELNEWVLSSGEVRLEGSTATFEDVNRLSEAFGHLPGVQQAVVAESKLGSDNRVSFRMRLVLGGTR